MLELAFLLFRRPDNTESRASVIFNFQFVKEAYTPYTKMNAVFAVEENPFIPLSSPYEYSEVLLNISGCNVHHGIIDSFKIVTEHGVKKGIITSRGFTSLLLDNQLEPGLYMNISIDKLIDEYYQLPYVTHEKGETENYIYVKRGTSMWDAVVSLSYKLYNTYPYINGQNKIMLMTGTPERELVFNDDSLLNYGAEVNTRRLVSDFHMEDTDGIYGKFGFHNSQAEEKNIVRNKYFDLDRRFLYEPEKASEFRNNIAMRSWKRTFCTYSGYSNEDLYDTVSFGNIVNRRIKSIKITGDRKGIQTELSVYDDGFMQ